MRNFKVSALLLLVLLYSGLRVVTWNYAVASSSAGSLDWWLCIAREISVYLLSVLLAWELWENKSFRQKVFAGRLGRQHSKLEFAFKAIVFVLIITAIATVVMPYRARVERAADSGVSLNAESNTALEENN